MIHATAFPRAALIGNPSDGYFGKTIAFVFRNFHASVRLIPSENIEIIPSLEDQQTFSSLHDLSTRTSQFGYYGGTRLIRAATKVFYDHCLEHRIELPEKGFTLSYDSDIPRSLGLAGSSAIITATFRCLMEYFGISIQTEILPNLVLAAENDELGIPAGLQDRVAQVYETPVYMDFDKSRMANIGFGNYIPIEPGLLPNIYIAWRRELAQVSSTVHHNIRERFDSGDPHVLDAMSEFATITDRFMHALKEGEVQEMEDLINRNFYIRTTLYEIGEEHMRMIELARTSGASAKFTGSGGAIIGIYRNEEVFESLCLNMEKEGYEVLKPDIVWNYSNESA